jgi:hypothetical protein
MVSEDGKSLAPVYLSHILSGGRSGEQDWHPYPRIQSSAHIDVSMPDQKTIKVTSVIDGVSSGTFSQSLLTDDVYRTYGERAVGHYFFCERGFVRLARAYRFGSDLPGVFSLSSDFLWLRRATDGSLVVLHRYGEGALVLVVPVGKTGVVWYRFLPVKP